MSKNSECFFTMRGWLFDPNLNGDWCPFNLGKSKPFGTDRLRRVFAIESPKSSEQSWDRYLGSLSAFLGVSNFLQWHSGRNVSHWTTQTWNEAIDQVLGSFSDIQNIFENFLSCCSSRSQKWLVYHSYNYTQEDYVPSWQDQNDRLKEDWGFEASQSTSIDSLYFPLNRCKSPPFDIVRWRDLSCNFYHP